MATNLSPYERERFEYGEVAGDNKGDLLRIHAIKAEHTANLLFTWLSGASSEVRLPNALPIERGGTGATTANRARMNLGMIINTNNEVSFGARAVSVYDGTVLDHDNTVKPYFIKNGVGDYTVGNVTGFNPTSFTYILPKDELGNLLCGCEITFAGEAIIKVYAVKFEDGIFQLDKTLPMDIPPGRCIDISVK